MKSEVSRIQEVYRQRKEKGIGWSIFDPEVHFMYFELQRKYMETFKLCGVDKKNISQKKILDAGCGDGKFLRWLQDLGFESLFGIDVQDQEIINAQRINPSINFLSGSISNLPFESNYFDFVILSEVFSSILDDRMLSESANEIFRVLSPGGAVIFHDNTRPETTSAKLEGKSYLRHIDKNVLKRLFPQAEINYSYCLVNPLFTGALASVINRGVLNSIFRKIPFLKKASGEKPVLMLRFPYCLAEMLKYFNFLNIHIFAVIQKPK